MQVQLGGRIEVDVASFEDAPDTAPAAGGTATLTRAAWAPPAPAMVVPAAFPDEIEVRVFSSEGGPTLMAAVELVSPRNKDRPEARRVFAAKCAAYLSWGVGLVVVDVVTVRQANLHDEMVRQLGLDEQFLLPAEAVLYAVAYRPALRQDRELVDVWPHTLALGTA